MPGLDDNLVEVAGDGVGCGDLIFITWTGFVRLQRCELRIYRFWPMNLRTKFWTEPF